MSLLSVRVFPHSDSDSDSDVTNNWAQYPFLSDSDSDAYMFNRALLSLSLCGNRPCDSNGDAACAVAIAVWKRVGSPRERGGVGDSGLFRVVFFIHCPPPGMSKCFIVNVQSVTEKLKCPNLSTSVNKEKAMEGHHCYLHLLALL